MRAVVQRVTHASVTVDGELLGQIGKGFLIFLGVAEGDTREITERMADKICRLRIFEDEQQKMNLSLLDIKGEALAVSQFTLAGDTSRGNRPGFETAARPELAKPLYEYFVDCLKSYGIIVKTGVFQADMQVSLINDGPVTFMLEKK